MRIGRRKALHGLHQLLGLGVGVFFVLLGLTGSLLVFYPEVDSEIHPSVPSAPKPSGDISAQKVYDVLRREYPDRMGSWRIELPMKRGQAIAARYYKPVETAHQKFAPLMVTLDPSTYQVTSSRYWGRYPMTWIYDLHYTLLADDWGHNTVGLIGVILLMSLLLGWWLWMPRWGRIGRSMKPVIRSQPVKKMYDLHVMSGVYGGILLAILALTGVVLAYPHASQRLASTLLEFERPMPTSRNLLAPRQTQANLDMLVQDSKVLFPHAEVRWVETSGVDGREVTLRLFNGNEPSRRFPQTYLKWHPVTAELLHQRDYHQLPTGDKLWAWVHPLHNGEAFGIFGRILVTLLGLLPAILMVTGFLRFMQKRRARALTRARERNRS